MSGIGLAFRWLDILEKEFDKNIVDINVSLGKAIKIFSKCLTYYIFITSLLPVLSRFSLPI